MPSPVGPRGREAKLLPLPVLRLGSGSQAAQEFIDALDAAGGVKVELLEPAQAQARLEEGAIHWLLEIPADLAASAAQPTTLRFMIHPDADEVEADSVALVVEGVADDMALESQLLDSFAQLEAMMAAAPEEYQVFDSEAASAQAKDQFQRSKTNPLVAVEQVMAAKEGLSLEFSASNVVVPGIAVLFIFLTAQVTAESVFREKKQGTFRRLLAAPLGKVSLLAGKLLPNLIVTLLQALVIFAVAIVVLPLLGMERLSLGSNLPALALLSLVTALCSTALGLMIAALAHSESQAGALSAVLLWVMAAVGGAFFPTFLMTGPLKALSTAVPHSWALRAFNDLLVYGQGLGDILPKLAVLLGFAAVFALIGLWRFDFD